VALGGDGRGVSQAFKVVRASLRQSSGEKNRVVQTGDFSIHVDGD